VADTFDVVEGKSVKDVSEKRPLRRKFCAGETELGANRIKLFAAVILASRHSANDTQHNDIHENNKLNATLSIMTLSIMALNAECSYTERRK
jgi:hypothetical protein